MVSLWTCAAKNIAPGRLCSDSGRVICPRLGQVLKVDICMTATPSGMFTSTSFVQVLKMRSVSQLVRVLGTETEVICSHWRKALDAKAATV